MRRRMRVYHCRRRDFILASTISEKKILSIQSIGYCESLERSSALRRISTMAYLLIAILWEHACILKGISASEEFIDDYFRKITITAKI